jgi:hypothetical protein
MTFSEPYMFVLAISAVVSIPLVLAIRTLLGTKQHVILPILRLRITNGHALIYEPSDPKTHEPHPFKQGGHHGDSRAVNGEKLGEH